MTIAFDTELLTVFITVSDCQSMNRSSEVLNLTQSTISKKVKQLENLTGRPLFNRHFDGISLTPFGSDLYPQAKKLLTAIDAFTDQFQHDPALSDLSVGALSSLSTHYYHCFFQKHLHDFKELTLSTQPEALIRNFNDHQLDVVLCDSALQEQITGYVVSQELLTENASLVYQKTHPLPDTTNLLLALSERYFLLYPDGCPVRTTITAAFTASDIPLPKIIPATDFEAILTAVSQTDTLTILPETLAADAARRYNLGTQPTPFHCQRTLSVFARSQRTLAHFVAKLTAL